MCVYCFARASFRIHADVSAEINFSYIIVHDLFTHYRSANKWLNKDHTFVAVTHQMLFPTRLNATIFFFNYNQTPFVQFNLGSFFSYSPFLRRVLCHYRNSVY